MSDDLDTVERMARAICKAQGYDPDGSPEEPAWSCWIGEAEAALAALCAGPLPRAVLRRALQELMIVASGPAGGSLIFFWLREIRDALAREEKGHG